MIWRTTAAIALSGVLLAMALGGAADAQTAQGSGTAPVREQNLDISGAIRVHEQGTADVNITNSSVPVTVGNFPAAQQVAGTVDVGNLPATQQVAGTVNVGNLPATQNVNVVGGQLDAVQPAVTVEQDTHIVDATTFDFEEHKLDRPVAMSLFAVSSIDKDEFRFLFRHQGRTVLELGGLDEGPPPTLALTQPIVVDEYWIGCRNEIDDCGFTITIAGTPL